MRVKLQLIATIISVIGIVGGVICKKFYPEYWTDAYLVSIVFFWVMEMAMSFVLDKFEPHINKPTLGGKHFMKVYMIAKGIKLTLTIIVIVAVGAALTGTDSRKTMVFTLSAVVLYLLHLAGETFVVTTKKTK